MIKSSVDNLAQGFINPAFPQLQEISSTNSSLINSSLSTTLKAVKSEKCHKHSAITITLLTPLTTQPPISVVHEPSRLEPGSSRAGSSPSSPGVPRARAGSSLLASSSWRLEQGSTSGLDSVGGSSRLGQGSTSRLDSRLEPLGAFLARSWRILGGSSLARVLESRCHLGSSPRAQGCHEPSRLEPRSGLGSSRLVNNTSYEHCTEPNALPFLIFYSPRE